MDKTVFIGHIQNDLCDTKTLVVAENAEEAKAKVIAKFSKSLGEIYQASDVHIWPFAANHYEH